MKKTYEIAIAMAGGVIFYNVLCPVLESVGNLIQVKIAQSINKSQIEMQLDQAEGQAASEIIQPNVNNTQAIGFNITPEDDDEGYYGKR